MYNMVTRKIGQKANILLSEIDYEILILLDRESHKIMDIVKFLDNNHHNILKSLNRLNKYNFIEINKVEKSAKKIVSITYKGEGVIDLFV